ncbi:MAG: formylglycine-generating enzyme family protein [Nitrospinota bacterium]|nr:formylglycine-generating enzyme family protein [Nitrospinota bacterium]
MILNRIVYISILLYLFLPINAAASMVMIPEGPFTMGKGSKPPHGPERRLFLKPFLIDQNEVTNEEFQQQFPNHRFRKGAARHPVTKVTWHQASEYCAKIGGRLPTDPEWEKAARGENGFNYPWGDYKPRKRPHPFYSGVVKKNSGSNKQDVSSYGIHDMAGSVWEWTGDAQGESKIIRGGLWNLHLDFDYSKAYEKTAIPPGERLSFLGFRCVRSLE